MGFFKSARDLKRQSDQISESWDPTQQLADAQKAMGEASEMMAEQTAAANLVATGAPGTATIAAVRQSGQMVNFQPVVELDLTIVRDGSPPYPATVSRVVPQVNLPAAQPGARVAVKIDPENPNSVWIDWATPAA